jgi:hypothetical protein
LSLASLAAPAAARTPVVVELYTAQGCSSCLKSGELIDDLANRPHVLPLTFGVDYWDYLGWPDSFAQPEFAERQRAYMKAMGLRDVYTPQVVVDGRTQAAALGDRSVDKLITAAARAPHDPPDVAFQGGNRVAVGSAHGRVAGEVWLVRYDPRDQSVLVKAGENRGKTITERNVVRQLIRLGAWKGRPKLFHLPSAPAEGLDTVVLVQADHGGRILAVKSATP